MRQVSEAVLASGVIDPEAAKLLERWGLEGATSVAERPDLVEALTEIERLVGRERGAYRVTKLDIKLGRYDPGVFRVVDGEGNSWLANTGEMGEIYVRWRREAPHFPREGDTLRIRGTRRVVTSAERLYTDEDLAAVRIEVADA